MTAAAHPGRKRMRSGPWESASGSSSAEVTMLQRSPTAVVRSDTLARLGRTLYSEEAVSAGISADVADLTIASTPFALQPAAVRGMQLSWRGRGLTRPSPTRD